MEFYSEVCDGNLWKAKLPKGVGEFKLFTKINLLKGMVTPQKSEVYKKIQFLRRKVKGTGEKFSFERWSLLK